MANKYLRRFMRTRLLSFTSHHQATASAAHKLKLKPMQRQLSNYSGNNIMQRQTLRASNHSSCLPHCLPSSCPAYNSSANEDGYVSAHEEAVEELESQLVRSNSCSKLQGRQFVPSFKSLLHRPSSHNHLHDNRHICHICKTHDRAAESSTSAISVSKYTRSRSAPSPHIGRHIIKLPRKASSFSSKEGSRGKRAPKGHVAIYVESGRERHVVPIAYLSDPPFQALLERAKSEFGFRQKGPGLLIPCSLSELHHALHQIRNNHSLPSLLSSH